MIKSKGFQRLCLFLGIVLHIAIYITLFAATFNPIATFDINPNMYLLLLPKDLGFCVNRNCQPYQITDLLLTEGTTIFQETKNQLQRMNSTVATGYPNAAVNNPYAGDQFWNPNTRQQPMPGYFDPTGNPGIGNSILSTSHQQPPPGSANPMNRYLSDSQDPLSGNPSNIDVPHGSISDNSDLAVDKSRSKSIYKATQPGASPATQPGASPATQPRTEPGTQPGIQPRTPPETKPYTPFDDPHDENSLSDIQKEYEKFLILFSHDLSCLQSQANDLIATNGISTFFSLLIHLLSLFFVTSAHILACSIFLISCYTFTKVSPLDCTTKFTDLPPIISKTYQTFVPKINYLQFLIFIIQLSNICLNTLSWFKTKSYKRVVLKTKFAEIEEEPQKFWAYMKEDENPDIFVDMNPIEHY